MRTFKILPLSTLIASLWAYSAIAQQPQPESSQDIVEAVQAAIMAADKPTTDGPWVIEEPARNYYHFGAVLDRQHKVLALTPGSDAERAAVKVGDTIVQINEAALSSTSLEDILAILNDFEETNPLAIKVNRAGKILDLHSTVTRRTIPAWRLEVNSVLNSQLNDVDQTAGCSFVSVFRFPPKSQQLFGARIRAAGETDFRNQPYDRNHIVKVAAGMQSIEISEGIHLDKIRRNRIDVQERKKQQTKMLELNLEPNKVYHLASRFFPNVAERGDPSQYWEPVVWKVTDRQCD